MDWSGVGTLYVPCLGSVEARRSYLLEYGGDGPELEAGGGAVRGWVRSGPGSARAAAGGRAGAPGRARRPAPRAGRDLRGLARDAASHAQTNTLPPRPATYHPQVGARALWQLALARCLTTLLPGLSGPILVSDPALTAFDRRLLAACGARAVAPGAHPEPTDAHGGGVFVYAPNCPHGVNEELLGDCLGALPRTAYLGTCAEFYEALDGLRARQRRAERLREGSSDGGGGGDGGGSSGALLEHAAGCACSGGGGEGKEEGCGGLSGGGELLVRLRREGRVVELGAPSFGHLHEACMRLHVFKPEPPEQGE
jgi:hypothetical protein